MKKDQFLSMIKPDGGKNKYELYYYSILYMIANNNMYHVYTYFDYFNPDRHKICIKEISITPDLQKYINSKFFKFKYLLSAINNGLVKTFKEGYISNPKYLFGNTLLNANETVDQLSSLLGSTEFEILVEKNIFIDNFLKIGKSGSIHECSLNNILTENDKTFLKDNSTNVSTRDLRQDEIHIWYAEIDCSTNMFKCDTLLATNGMNLAVKKYFNVSYLSQLPSLTKLDARYRDIYVNFDIFEKDIKNIKYIVVDKNYVSIFYKRNKLKFYYSYNSINEIIWKKIRNILEEKKYITDVEKLEYEITGKMKIWIAKK